MRPRYHEIVTAGTSLYESHSCSGRTLEGKETISKNFTGNIDAEYAQGCRVIGAKV
jgi:hypothetical protein